MDNNQLEKTVKVLNSGGIVVFPTDTAFGIGCRIDRLDAIEKLFVLKRRPKNQALPVLVSSIAMAESYYSSPLPDIVRRLIKAYWPGALTVVYKRNKELVPALVSGGLDSVGIRMPNFPFILKVIEEIKVPLLAPSANFHSLPTPHRFSALDPKLLKQVDLVVPQECPGSSVSTVIDCVPKPVKILRQGKLTIDPLFLK